MNVKSIILIVFLGYLHRYNSLICRTNRLFLLLATAVENICDDRQKYLRRPSHQIFWPEWKQIQKCKDDRKVSITSNRHIDSALYVTVTLVFMQKSFGKIMEIQ